eukprot:NODE_51_length_31136_cov_0.357670.p16 type:complete len:238 gc:universal NODE_51_length_31136_cov_0.357670:27110-26397(-)
MVTFINSPNKFSLKQEMEWFHCHICVDELDLQGPGLPNIGSCGHSFCSKCIQQVSSVCPVCNKEITLNCLWDEQGIVPELQAFFNPSEKIINDMQSHIRAMNYQLRNYKDLVVRLRRRHLEMQQAVEKAKQELVDRKTLQTEILRLRQQLNKKGPVPPPHQLLNDINLNTYDNSPSKDFSKLKSSTISNSISNKFRRDFEEMPTPLKNYDDMDSFNDSPAQSVISRSSMRSRNPFYK